MFAKVVAKNRAFGNNTMFLQKFIRFRWGWTFPVFPPPGGAYVYYSVRDTGKAPIFYVTNSSAYLGFVKLEDQMLLRHHLAPYFICTEILYFIILYILYDPRQLFKTKRVHVRRAQPGGKGGIPPPRNRKKIVVENGVISECSILVTNFPK